LATKDIDCIASHPVMLDGISKKLLQFELLARVKQDYVLKLTSYSLRS